MTETTVAEISAHMLYSQLPIHQHPRGFTTPASTATTGSSLQTKL